MLESDDWPNCPDGSCRPIPVGDSDAFSKTKAWEIFQTNNPPPPPPYIDATNWQGLYNLWWNQKFNPPSWFRAEFWNPNATLQDAWYNFCTTVAGGIQRAGQDNNPDWYLETVGIWNKKSAAANNGTPIRFPVINSNGISYSARRY